MNDKCQNPFTKQGRDNWKYLVDTGLIYYLHQANPENTRNELKEFIVFMKPEKFDELEKTLVAIRNEQNNNEKM
jgi:hypothetical protein